MPSAEAVRRSTPLIAALLRGELPETVREADAEEAAALAEACVVHGVYGVLYHQFAGVPEQWHALPEALREPLESRARIDQAWELAHKAELIASLATFSDARVDVLITKGTALAYSLYPVPSIRSRGDTDLFVPAQDAASACDVMAELGYARDTHSQAIGCEVNFTKKDRFGLEHVLDVHWRLSSNELFAELLNWEDARRASDPVPALGVNARRLSYVHALLHACVHRAVHGHSPYYVNGEAFLERNRLIWLYDIGLLAAAMQEPDWVSFAALARERAVSAVCHDALRAARDLIGASIPMEVERDLSVPARSELSARLLTESASHAVWLELLAQRGMLARLKFLRELLFPQRAYMRRKYPGSPNWAFPYLYVRRAAQGVRRRMTHFR